METKRNVFECNNVSISKFPGLPALTQKIVFRATELNEITAKDVAKITGTQSVNTLNLTENKIRRISEQVKNLKNVEQIWLGGNPIECNCDMVWMIGWLNTRVNSSQESLVRDFRDVHCSNGKFGGLPIYLISTTLLGCYPHSWTTSQKVGLTFGALIVGLLFGVIIIVVRRPKEVKFLLYYYLRMDTIPRDESSEDVTNKEYDAFFCYW